MRPPRQRLAPPGVAFQLGLMPNATTGVSGWRLAHPTYDGRGVLIAILDSGLDPGIQGFQSTTTGENKILDLRDFSGEGDVALTELAVGSWQGVLREIVFGDAPAADFNDDGDNRDTFRIEVSRDTSGWRARIDTNGDGVIANETWMRDYLAARETFTFWGGRVARGRGPITAAFNLSEEDGRPKLSVFLDNSAHGSHVAGIAAGNGIYGVSGFNGAAPGAQIIALKIADNARGGVSTNGSMARAMEYAWRFARQRRLPLVMNMSFGVGNGNEGRATMDSIVTAFLAAHPEVVFAIAAGNDGPGTSTLGEPGSANLAVTVGGIYPGSFAALQFGTNTDAMAWFSSRGGELNKPDILAPGLAYSTVPGWNTGEEVKGGTSMATPHISGVAAALISAMIQEQRPWSAASILQALRATARRVPGATAIDAGPGIAQIEAAYQWLKAQRDVPRFLVEAIPAAVPMPPGMMPAGQGQRQNVAPMERGPRVPAAYRRGTLAAGDTIQRFRITQLAEAGRRGGQAAATGYRLVSDTSWLRATTPTITIDPRTNTAVVEVHYDTAALRQPGRHVGTVSGWDPNDSAAGPAFTLVNTIITPIYVTLDATGRVDGGTAERFYLHVPEGAGGLHATLTARDTTLPATLYLFEPAGRPARGGSSAELGGEHGRSASLTVAAEDAVPGAWEIIVQAMPGRELHYELEAGVIPLRPAQLGGVTGSGALALGAFRDTTITVAVDLIGAARSEDVTIERGAPVRRQVTVPAWAKRLVVEVEVTADVWDLMTDFALTVYDSSGAQVENSPMTYPFHRLTAEFPPLRPASYVATVELFPAFAHPTPPARVPAKLRLRFEGEPRPVVAPAPIRVTARGAASLPFTAPASPEPGWLALVLLRAGAADDPAAMIQRLVLPAR